MTILLLYLLCGATAGFLSGLIGIGGGLVVVPLLNMIFRLQSNIAPELIMHLAVGTSLSSILFTAVSSTRSHARMGGVLWKYVLGLSPAIVIGTLCAFIIVSAAVIILRKKNPNQQRAFKCPLVPLVPALAIVFCGILIYMLPLVTQIRFVVWLLVGLAIYFGYGYSHSIISKTRRSAVPAGSAAANMNPAAQPTKGH